MASKVVPRIAPPVVVNHDPHSRPLSFARRDTPSRTTTRATPIGAANGLDVVSGTDGGEARVRAWESPAEVEPIPLPLPHADWNSFWIVAYTSPAHSSFSLRLTGI